MEHMYICPETTAREWGAVLEQAPLVKKLESAV